MAGDRAFAAAAARAAGSRKFLVDGFPRNLDNLEKWFEMMGNETMLSMVLFFDCPEHILEERILERGKTSGRSDDNLDSIKKRCVVGPLPV